MATTSSVLHTSSGRWARCAAAGARSWAGGGVAAALLLFAVGSPARSQEVFVDQVDVQLVNVEVWVTDQQGRPVTGLLPRNFEVREDGERVELSHFAEITPEVAFGEVEPGAALTPGSGAPPPALNHLVLFFDDATTGVASRTRLIADLRRFVAEGDVPADRILLLRFGETLEVEATFGSTREELDAGLDRIAASAGPGNLNATEKRRTLDQLQELWRQAQQLGSRGDPCFMFLRQGRPVVMAWARSRQGQILRSIDALRAAATMVSGVPGMKTMVYASDALETSPGESLIGFMDSVCPGRSGELQRQEFDGTLVDPLEVLSRHANANRVTIYTLQASGLAPEPQGNASQPGGMEVRAIGRFASASRISERTGLQLLAEETGGRMLVNANDASAQLREVADELGNYYSLAFTPSHDGDGGDHRIAVRVLGNDYRVRYRRSYHDKSSRERLEEQLQSVLFLGDIGNALDIGLAAGGLEAVEGGRTKLGLHILVPMDRVTFLPASDGEFGRIEAQVSIRDARNRTSVTAPRTYPVEKPQEGGNDRFAIRFDLELDPGPVVIGVAVRDMLSQETSLVSTTVEIPEPPPNG